MTFELRLVCILMLFFGMDIYSSGDDSVVSDVTINTIGYILTDIEKITILQEGFVFLEKCRQEDVQEHVKLKNKGVQDTSEKYRSVDILMGRKLADIENDGLAGLLRNERAFITSDIERDGLSFFVEKD